MRDRCWRKRCGVERPRGSRSSQWQGFLRIAVHPYGRWSGRDPAGRRPASRMIGGVRSQEVRESHSREPGPVCAETGLTNHNFAWPLAFPVSSRRMTSVRSRRNKLDGDSAKK